jgi:hypothetical protein
VEFAAEPKYKSLEWLKLPVESLHKGYFSEDKKHVLKDTSGSTQADDDTYNLIMKDKETLLSLDTAAPLHLQPFGTARRLGQSERLPDLHAQRNAQRHQEAAGNWARAALARESGWAARL